MSDQRELNLSDCAANFAPPTETRLFQRLFDLAGFSALRSLGGRSTTKAQAWDGLEPFDMLRGWRCGEE
ncbi:MULTISPECIES: hypothetical protein [Phyllobacterium]|jgi:hypothetical protein|uniref:hypothetical protein n=1 Tax=Phyllobacterium TaxID=28100 RepID=UPI000883E2D0|nr:MULTISPECIES: hypothetical protein [unclassified Phyllobacterium]UGX86623.1 hypothetical protein LLE53_001740 [Phyllobacterium sp. T1293]SDO05559.1 hypothetical protein SAMN05443582_101844 [Phyllobacterium sp. OV277]